jgi:hypothetical protein
VTDPAVAARVRALVDPDEARGGVTARPPEPLGAAVAPSTPLGEGDQAQVVEEQDRPRIGASFAGRVHAVRAWVERSRVEIAITGVLTVVLFALFYAATSVLMAGRVEIDRRMLPFLLACSLVAAFAYGVALMRVGETFEFAIPADLAYGDRWVGGDALPPGSALLFTVELLDVTPAGS